MDREGTLNRKTGRLRISENCRQTETAQSLALRRSHFRRRNVERSIAHNVLFLLCVVKAERKGKNSKKVAQETTFGESEE